MNYSFAAKARKTEFVSPELISNHIDQNDHYQFARNKSTMFVDDVRIPEKPSITYIDSDSSFIQQSQDIKPNKVTYDIVQTKQYEKRMHSLPNTQRIQLSNIDKKSMQTKIKTRTHQNDIRTSTTIFDKEADHIKVDNSIKKFSTKGITTKPLTTIDIALTETQTYVDLDPVNNNMLNISMNEQFAQIARLHKSIKTGSSTIVSSLTFAISELSNNQKKSKDTQSVPKHSTYLAASENSELQIPVTRMNKEVSNSIVKFNKLGKFDDKPLSQNIVNHSKIDQTILEKPLIFESTSDLEKVTKIKKSIKHVTRKKNLDLHTSNDILTQNSNAYKESEIHPTYIQTLQNDDIKLLKHDHIENNNEYKISTSKFDNHKTVVFVDDNLKHNNILHDPTPNVAIKPIKHDEGLDVQMHLINNWSDQ
jgi:hypothetical protein